MSLHTKDGSRTLARIPNARRERRLIEILDSGPVTPSALETLARLNRSRAEFMVQSLIDALDALDPDPDLEPSLGQTMPGHAYDAEADSDNGFEADREPGLGSPEALNGGGHVERRLGHTDQRHWADGNRTREFDGCEVEEDESTAPERHGVGFVRCSEDDVEDVSEDEGADIQAQPHDEEHDEPSLGSPEVHHDQRRWGQGKAIEGAKSREGDHDEAYALDGSWEARIAREKARHDARSLVARITGSNVIPFAPPRTSLGARIVGVIHD